MRENTSVLRTIVSKAKIGTQVTESALITAANIISGTPKWNAGNLLPSDHAGVLDNVKDSPTFGRLTLNPSQSAQRADYIMAKVGRGLYEIVAPSAYVSMPQTGGKRASSNPAVARKEALALLGITEESLQPKVAPPAVAVVPAVVPASKK
jgi:hypothetical protein